LDHERFMQEALVEARKALEITEVPIGAVIARGEEVIGRGYNLREATGDPTAHAEILAIRQASQHVSGWRLTGCTIYVTIEPCPMCAGAIVLARLDRLVFGAFDPKAGAAGSLLNIVDDERFNHKVEVVSGVMEQQCSDMMKSFFRELRQGQLG
jgi:tRNA(adenine34) deaminase